jgi:hypothetical protein
VRLGVRAKRDARSLRDRLHGFDIGVDTRAVDDDQGSWEFT